MPITTTPDRHRDHHDHQHDHHPDDDHPDDHHRDRGHGAHAGHGAHGAMFGRLFWWSLLLAIPVIVSSEMVQEWFGYRLTFPGADAIAPVLGTVVFAVGGRPFLTGAVAEVRHRRPGMMLLIAVAISVALAASAASTFGVGELDFWWELVALIVVMLLGHWLEMRALGQASGALDALATLLPDAAERVTGTTVERVAVGELQPGDVVLVRPGARVPADGEVVGGSANLDESMITGESRPVARAVGDRVVAGTVSLDAALRIRVSAVGDDTALAGIRRLVADAQASRSRAQALADRAAGALFAIAVGAAAIAMVAWTAVGSPSTGIVAVVTVLVIACPHALGLAIPLVVSISTSVSARAGILVKDRLALERMRHVDVVLFDKTGTLTLGNHVVRDHVAVAPLDADEVLRTAAAIEGDSEHPIARAIVAAGRATGDLPVASDFATTAGIGVDGRVAGRHVHVGGPALLRHLELTEPEEFVAVTTRWRDRGDAVVYVVDERRVIGAITVADEVRPESRAAVAELHRRGKRVALVTGDAQQVAAAIAHDLGIDEYVAEVLPAAKDEVVASLQRSGLRVAMVGDGVNDAPALARADVGIAIGAGTDVAVESAGVVLVSDDPRAVSAVIDLSTASYRTMVQNLVWATGYNLGAIPVAAGALAFAGITIPPAMAAIAMSLSTIVVAANAQLLRRLDLRAVPMVQQ